TREGDGHLGPVPGEKHENERPGRVVVAAAPEKIDRRVDQVAVSMYRSVVVGLVSDRGRSTVTRRPAETKSLHSAVQESNLPLPGQIAKADRPVGA
ncbi:MAG: hypothetical protein M3R70_03155, partial [Actinomycetota bacterium]|nr:hypothetical protein [Actinomycetota bacterium]